MKIVLFILVLLAVCLLAPGTGHAGKSTGGSKGKSAPKQSAPPAPPPVPAPEPLPDTTVQEAEVKSVRDDERKKLARLQGQGGTVLAPLGSISGSGGTGLGLLGRLSR